MTVDRDSFLIFRITIAIGIARRTTDNTLRTTATTGTTHGDPSPGDEGGEWVMMLLLAEVVSKDREPVDGKKAVLMSRPKKNRYGIIYYIRMCVNVISTRYI